tara:strand:+ start:1042 stop:3312 length:2271 start_codon:yes stop_codon:yes gene_type:complete
MVKELQKAEVTLNGSPLAATSNVVWSFVGGVAPYMTTFTAHRKEWEAKIKRLMLHRVPAVLRIVDARGEVTSINCVSVLHVVPSDSPNRVSFVVADKRWKWPYKVILRDFNMPRKTGDRTAQKNVMPELQTYIDKFDYLRYSLKDSETVWTAKEALVEVMEILEGRKGDTTADPCRGWRVESFPINDEQTRDAGSFTLQGITLRDQGDVALARLLSYIPGADVYINASGTAVIYDATDLEATETHFRQLPDNSYEGQRAAMIDRSRIRPSKVIVYYQREVECVFDYSDDYAATTVADPIPEAPYIENVLPTVDPTTDIVEYDSGARRTIAKTGVGAGTWVRVDNWLRAMNETKNEFSAPWRFDMFRPFYYKGDLEHLFGAGGKYNVDTEANHAFRVRALTAHFRKTFRINREYMERIRSIRNVRVALLDPVSGARAPAGVWGQATYIPTIKGQRMAGRNAGLYFPLERMVDNYPDADKGETVLNKAASPALVSFVDEDLGIFTLDWQLSPYGGMKEWVLPCHLQNKAGVRVTTTKDLKEQDTKPLGPGMKVEGNANGLYLANDMKLKIMVTIVPSAPNNKNQFHPIEVKPEEIKKLFRKEYRISGGKGPPLEIFVPPGEATARFAWSDDAKANQTVRVLLGLDDDTGGGIVGPDLPGFELINENRHLLPHARAVAAELMTPYADNIQGVVSTVVPRRTGLKLVGNMSAATVRVGVAPSAKVEAIHTFPGQQRKISRMAIMPESARKIVLGIVPFPK